MNQLVTREAVKGLIPEDTPISQRRLLGKVRVHLSPICLPTLKQILDELEEMDAIITSRGVDPYRGGPSCIVIRLKKK